MIFVIPLFLVSNLLSRNELQLSMGDHLHKYMIIDQQNTPKNYIFKFGTRRSSPKVMISEDVHKLLPSVGYLSLFYI